MTFAENMKARREELKMTQVSLSKRSGVPQSTISAVERGSRIPTSETMRLLAKGLRCSVDFLLNGAENDMEKPAADIGGLDEQLVEMLIDLPDQDVQRVKDFVSGLKAAQKE